MARATCPIPTHALTHFADMRLGCLPSDAIGLSRNGVLLWRVPDPSRDQGIIGMVLGVPVQLGASLLSDKRQV